MKSSMILIDMYRIHSLLGSLVETLIPKNSLQCNIAQQQKIMMIRKYTQVHITVDVHLNLFVIRKEGCHH
jgi:hypothetical protein